MGVGGVRYGRIKRMRLIREIIKKIDLKKGENVFNGEMVKGVVDVKKELLGVDGSMHADIEAQMLKEGSRQDDLWGINLYLDDEEDWIEFDSMINIRPRQGNRSRSVENEEIREKIKQVVEKWVK